MYMSREDLDITRRCMCLIESGILKFSRKWVFTRGLIIILSGAAARTGKGKGKERNKLDKWEDYRGV